MQNGEITGKRPESTRLPVVLMATEHVAVQFRWLTIELSHSTNFNRIKMAHSLIQPFLEHKILET